MKQDIFRENKFELLYFLHSAEKLEKNLSNFDQKPSCKKTSI